MTPTGFAIGHGHSASSGPGNVGLNASKGESESGLPKPPAPATPGSSSSMTPEAVSTDDDHSESMSSVDADVLGELRRISGAVDDDDLEDAVDPDDPNDTYIARLYVRIQKALEQLEVPLVGGDAASDDEGRAKKREISERIEAMSVFIHASMSKSSRNYHSVGHVFDVARRFAHTIKYKDPVAVLAAIFHDCVYHHVDGGLSEMQEEKLRGVMSNDEYIARQSPGDELLCMVEDIFGYEPGKPVTNLMGLNEMLSAVICVRELEPILRLLDEKEGGKEEEPNKKPKSKAILAQMACCIESTIPFRGKEIKTVEINGDDGEKKCVPSTATMERLYENMKKANETYGLGMSDEELVRSVQRATLVANQDVANFGTCDHGHFLDNTWSLLPETNTALRSQHLYTVQEFQGAVFKMQGFFQYFLKDSKMIFYTFRGSPEAQEFERRTTYAARNLEVARMYMTAKLLSLSVVAAFAELTGGDAPLCLFSGDLPGRSQNKPGRRLSDALPTRVAATALNSAIRRRSSQSPLAASKKFTSKKVDRLGLSDKSYDPDVLSLLSHGRNSETSFDFRESPLAAYFYSVLGDEKLTEIVRTTKLHPIKGDRDAAFNLLVKLPLETVECVSKGMMTVAVSRADRLKDLLGEIRKAKQQPQESK